MESMYFCAISSGSKANCTFVQKGNTRILIDCGLSAKQAALRLQSIGVDPESIDAIVVSHEHQDHIRGISVFSRRHSVPVYVNAETAVFLENIFEINEFDTGRAFCIGELSLSPFRIIHDASDPVGYRITDGSRVLTIATDLGRSTPLVVDAIRGCDALILEANYDQAMLNDCLYPWQVKQRISSSHGHLSNREAAELLDSVLHEDLQIVVLGHLSENSNSPERALEVVRKCSRVSDFCEIVCASQSEPSPLFEITSKEGKSSEAA